MESIQALRERHAAVAKEVRTLVENKNAAWTKEDQEAYDKFMAQVDDIAGQIGRQEQLLAKLAEDKTVEQVLDAAGHRVKKVDAAVRQIFDKFMRTDARHLTNDDWDQIRNTMSTTTGSEGGYTVPTEVAKTVADALKSLGGMRSVATVIQTNDGADMNFPTSDGTAEEGEIIAQNTAANALDTSFGTVLIPTYKYSSKVVAIPYELLQDSAVDILALINLRLNQRIGRITNKHFTIGTGTSQPKGIDVAATLGKTGTTGQTTSVIVDDLIDLEHSVDYAYREGGNCKWMMNDSSFKVIKKLKDSTGRPIFMPGYDGLGGKMPDTILGYGVVINNHMPVMAANAKSILFGDFSYYVIRDVLNSVMVQRYDDSAYASKGQRGFHMWMRSGGNFVDVGGAVKYYANSAT
jgi:HK97 family phage major capsid protein